MKGIFLVIALGFAGCAKYASVSRTQPQFPLKLVASHLQDDAERIASAQRLEKDEPLAALGHYLETAQDATRQLIRDPRNIAARALYNYAIARGVSALQRAHPDPWAQALRVPSSAGEFTVTYRPDPQKRRAWNPALYDFTPADEFSVKGAYVSEHQKKAGIGAPVVATGKGNNADAKKDFSLPKTYYGLTALVRFQGNRAVFCFEDPLAVETVSFAGRAMPLAADYTVPLGVMLASTEYNDLGLARLLRPEKYAETARVARLQPYDPNKTVVLVVHGLMSSPSTWTPMINRLRANAEIRKNYQFWFYSYPSGYPFPHSAAILRRELDAIERRFPLHNKMVVIGHSMGGCISRLLITDAGDKLWLGAFKRPPEQVSMSPSSKALFSEALIFNHRPEIGRVIFISSPLRGSDMAGSWIGRIGASLVKSPVTLLKAGTEALKFVAYGPNDLKLKRIPNSVDTLAPNNHFVKAINTIPVHPGIPCHVICGNRGKGGNKDQTKPVMSDGLVPYWSSHMPMAKSELIVPSHHSAHQHAQAIKEVERILTQTTPR